MIGHIAQIGVEILFVLLPKLREGKKDWNGKLGHGFLL